MQQHQYKFRKRKCFPLPSNSNTIVRPVIIGLTIVTIWVLFTWSFKSSANTNKDSKYRPGDTQTLLMRESKRCPCASEIFCIVYVLERMERTEGKVELIM